MSEDTHGGAFAPLLYRPRDVQRVLGIGESKFYQLVRDGEIEIKKLGLATVVTAEELRRFVDNLPTASR